MTNCKWFFAAIAIAMLAACSPASLQKDDDNEVLSKDFRVYKITGAYRGNPVSITFFVLMRNKNGYLDACGGYQTNTPAMWVATKRLVTDRNSGIIIGVEQSAKTFQSDINRPFIATFFFTDLGVSNPVVGTTRVNCNFTHYPWNDDILTKPVRFSLESTY